MATFSSKCQDLALDRTRKTNIPTTAAKIKISTIQIAKLIGVAGSAQEQRTEMATSTLNKPLMPPAGSYLLQLSGTDKDGNALTVALETLVAGDQTMKTWAKRLPGNTEAKLYAKTIVGAGKVVFNVNGKEIAWVRTIKLNMGKNILEVYIDEERTTRVAYSRK